MPAKTKKLIVQSFLELAKHKPIDKITVTGIVEKCNISRQGFYYHFQYIIDVIVWSVEQTFQKTLAASLQANSPKTAVWEFILAAVTEQEILQRLFNLQKHDHMEAVLVHAVQTYLTEKPQHADMNIPGKFSDIMITIEFYSYGIVGLLQKRYEQKNLDINQLARQICQLLKVA